MFMMISRRLARIHNLHSPTFRRDLRVRSAFLIPFGSMSFRDSEKWSFLHQILSLSGVRGDSSRRSSQSSSSTGTANTSFTEDGSQGYVLGTNDKSHLLRRKSTIDDEARVVALLKEILAYQNTNISNWIIEASRAFTLFVF